MLGIVIRVRSAKYGEWSKKVRIRILLMDRQNEVNKYHYLSQILTPNFVGRIVEYGAHN